MSSYVRQGTNLSTLLSASYMREFRSIATLTLKLLINFRVFKLLLALWASNNYLAGPEGQQKISNWPKGPAKDLLQPEAAHDLLWPDALLLIIYLKLE